MARIDWILKPNGPGQMGDVVSHQAGVIRAVQHTAQKHAASPAACCSPTAPRATRGSP
jgi:hypothetical protein